MWARLDGKMWRLGSTIIQNKRAQLCKYNKQVFSILASSYNVRNLIEACTSIVGKKNVSMAPSTLEQHSHDESYYRRGLPNLVVWPSNVQEVSEIAKICNANRVPIIPFGTGTGGEGGVVPIEGGICLNLTMMDEMFDLHIEDFDVTVQPGVTRIALNEGLRKTGLWFPVDPGADASLCGMAATSASGTNAVRYGTMKENVMNLQVVLPDGKIIHTAGEKRRFKKSAAGYNLTNLFVGSEGTLGIITSATLRLHALPECTLSAVCSFTTIADAVTCATDVIRTGIPIARIELLDECMVDAINKYSNLSYPVSPTLLLEFHGSENGAREQVEKTAELVNMNGGSSFDWAENQEARNKLWKARHDASYAILALEPGSLSYSTDVCVPMSHLPEAVLHAAGLLAEANITSGIVGHVGDGNFHCLCCIDPSDEKEKELIVELSDKIAEKALSLGGTCTGEHGIGLGKKELLLKEVGKDGIAVMKTVKSVIDPLGIMNPGKIF